MHFFMMFWNKRNKADTKKITDAIEFIILVSVQQYLTLSLFGNSGVYDPKNNARQKVLTYLYYDILAGSLIGSDTQQHIDGIALCRDVCLQRFDKNGFEQFRTYHADQKGGYSSLEASSIEVHEFLETYPIFAREALAKISDMVAVIDDISGNSDKLGQLYNHVKDLVLDEDLEYTLEVNQAMSSANKHSDNESVISPIAHKGPWGSKSDSVSQDDKHADLLKRIITQQVANVTAFAESLRSDDVLRFQVISYYYCSFLIAMFLKIDDPDIVQVKSRQYLTKLTGQPSITIAEFEDYLKQNPIFAKTVNELVSNAIKNISRGEFIGSEISNHLLGIIKQLMLAQLHNLSITCQYCGNCWKLQDMNILTESTLYCIDDYKIDESSGLQVNACLCFACRRVTEFSADPLNESDLSEDGIEYLRTKPLSGQLLFEFYQNAKTHENEIAQSKMEKLIQAQA